VSDPLRPDAAEALAAWAKRVRSNREQVDRVREVPDADFYAPVAAAFRPERTDADDPLVAALASLAGPGDIVLDIGAGGGRYAVPLGRIAHSVIAVEPSPAMRDTLVAAAAEAGLRNVDIVAARWPMPEVPRADLVLAANVLYDIEEVGPFLDGMEQSARRLCVAVLLELPPPFAVDALWPAVHGEPRASLPALPEFIALQLARGHVCEVRLLERPPGPIDPDAFLARARRMLWVREGSDADHRLLAAIAARPGGGPAPPVGVATWAASRS